MTSFTWSVKDRNGQQIFREVLAETSQESQRLLLADGCTDLVLKEDEISHVVRSAMPRELDWFGQKISVTAKDRLKPGNRSTSFFGFYLESLWTEKWPFLVLLGLGGAAIYSGNTELILRNGLRLLEVSGILFYLCLPVIFHRKLTKAADWNRWKKVLRLVGALELIRKFHVIKIPASALARHRAKAMAATVGVDSALREYQKYENQPDCPSWLYKSHVASIYDLVKQHDKAVEIQLMALAEKPVPTLYLDLANRYARHKKDYAKAYEALTEAEKSPITEGIMAGYHRIKGVVAYVGGNYALAKQELETSIRLVKEKRYAFFRDGSLAIARGYLCCTLAKLNDRSGAEKNFRAARRYLEATDEVKLIEECEMELGKK